MPRTWPMSSACPIATRSFSTSAGTTTCPDRSSIWATVASSSGSDRRSSGGRLAPVLKVARVANAVPVDDRAVVCVDGLVGVLGLNLGITWPRVTTPGMASLPAGVRVAPEPIRVAVTVVRDAIKTCLDDQPSPIMDQCGFDAPRPRRRAWQPAPPVSSELAPARTAGLARGKAAWWAAKGSCANRSASRSRSLHSTRPIPTPPDHSSVAKAIARRVAPEVQKR